MTDSPQSPTAGPTTLVFQAPPPLPHDDLDDLDDLDEDFQREDAPGRRADTPSAGRRAALNGAGDLRMLKGARAAAAGMNISDAQIRTVLEDPQDVQPDEKQPQRSQLSRGGIVVTIGNDGMILRVARRR